MDIKSKMNTKFRDLQGGLFLTVTTAVSVSPGPTVFRLSSSFS